VPVPWDDEHVFYVWFDALLNYYTALSFAREGEDLTERFWPATVHLIAKDILKFHAVFWPALLMAAGLELPDRIYIHGYLLMDEHKMSKSLGNVIDPFEVSDVFGADALRYYLMAAVGFGQDGNVSTEDFENRYTSELANEYGNLAGRTLAMIRQYREGVVPDAEPAPELVALFGGAVERFSQRLDDVEITAALDDSWQLVRALNRYVQEQAPWQLAKEPAEAARLDSVLYGLAEGLRVLAVLLHPYLPESAGRLLAALGQEDLSLESAQFGTAGGGAHVGDLAPLFPRIERSAA
jgi:methionyl-tRNA synthetase